MSEVWVVDDDQSMRWVLERSLTKDGFAVESFASPREALARLQTARPRVVLSDIRMPGMSGLEFLEQMRLGGLTAPVIIMTAYSDLESAVSAFQGGAYEYLAKPFDLPAATALVRRALSETQANGLVEAGPETMPELMGQAPAMQELFRAIGRLSTSNATVLVTGESGTGKELVARALHRHSGRKNEAFVALNTAAIPRDLLESELFGHERGSFTGAQQQRRGRFEQAEGGTLFLDEIGDMPSELQTRLLRVLSDGHFYRVGGHQPIRSNVRVIAATHQHLEQRVAQGLFREDLFHRLNVIRLRIPALRERREDIALLVNHFMRQSAQQLAVEPKRLSLTAIDALTAFAWPGNVRQLENLCHWINVMTPGQVADVVDLPVEIRAAPTMRMETVASSVSTLSSASASSLANETGLLPAESLLLSEGSPKQNAETLGALGNFASVQLPYDRALADLGYPINNVPVELQARSQAWVEPLRALAKQMLLQQPKQLDLLPEGQEHSQMMAELTRCFEAALIQSALQHTRGRRIEAAQRLGIGRNTITRKIQELGLKE
jgi:two-component system, NtrC family, nitrogen regulation response regulator GlnG